MKGFRFYAELPDERTSKTARMINAGHDFEPFTRASIRRWADQGGKLNVVAALLTASGNFEWLPGQGDMIEAIVSVYGHENAAVCTGSTSRAYLRKRATQVDEATARKLHPHLFATLDAAD